MASRMVSRSETCKPLSAESGNTSRPSTAELQASHYCSLGVLSRSIRLFCLDYFSCPMKFCMSYFFLPVGIQWLSVQVQKRVYLSRHINLVSTKWRSTHYFEALLTWIVGPVALSDAWQDEIDWVCRLAWRNPPPPDSFHFSLAT